MNTPAPKVFHQVTIVETGEVYRCREDETLLAGMERLGKRGIPVGCRGGGCGVCKVQVEAGEYSKRVMSRAYVSAEEEAAGIVLACRVKPLSDIRLAVLGKMKKNVRDAVSGGRGRKAVVETGGRDPPHENPGSAGRTRRPQPRP